MTIDEAIANAREVAERNRILLDSDELVQKSYDAHFDKLKCEKCAEKHEQLAEWLEELKTYREIGTVEECKESVLDIEKAYNKAIDDFAEILIRYVDCGHLCSPTEARWSDLSVVKMVEELAEQLKAGGDNDNLRR